MKIPGFIRGKANKGNKVAAEFIRQYDNGDNTPYDPEAYAAIKAQMGEDGVLDDSFEDDAPRPEDFEQNKVSPAEQKAQERIEELGKQYGGSQEGKYDPASDYGKSMYPDERVYKSVEEWLKTAETEDDFEEIYYQIDEALARREIDYNQSSELYDKVKAKQDHAEKRAKEDKPLHVQSLENQVARNPEYKKIADSLSKEDDVNDAYFYAFKDAYEKHGYEPSNEHIENELSDAYWSLADSYRDRYGMSDSEWDNRGWADFEDKYGTEDDFIDKGLKAHDKYFGELSGPEPSDISDDEISEALADSQWSITQNTTVDSYASEVAEKLGVDKDRVLNMIKRESPDIKDTDKMAKVAGLEDDETYTRDDLGYKKNDKGGFDVIQKDTEERDEKVLKSVNSKDEAINYIKSLLNEQPSERDQDIAKIQAITDRINSYDADSAEGYLTTDESKLIKDLAQKHKLTADDLKKIGGRVFADYGYGTDEFAYKEPSEDEHRIWNEELAQRYADGDVSHEEGIVIDYLNGDMKSEQFYKEYFNMNREKRKKADELFDKYYPGSPAEKEDKKYEGN